jgi:hypothetical protein
VVASPSGSVVHCCAVAVALDTHRPIRVELVLQLMTPHCGVHAVATHKCAGSWGAPFEVAVAQVHTVSTPGLC